MTAKPLVKSDFQTHAEYRRWALACIKAYQAHAEDSYRLAEQAACMAIDLKEEGNLALGRAAVIAGDLARFLDSKD